MRSSIWRATGVMPIAATLALTLSGATHAQEASSATAKRPSDTLEELVVTARRREESAQTTPVAVSVISAEALYTGGIKEIRDLTSQVPGVTMSTSGGNNNTVFSIRGRSRGVIGNAQPSVAEYVNEVPLSVWGASIPTYDMSSIQVLKGPQGTLFGRNTTTGAVLVTTQAPTNEFGGYASAIYGDYSWQQYEAALNVPLLQDKIALRVAGQIARRDGYTKNMSIPGHDFDDIHKNNYRISLLLTPFEGFKNTTVFENNDSNENGAGVGLYRYSPGKIIDTVPYYNGTFRTLDVSNFPASIPNSPLCNGNPACDVHVAAARAINAGPRKVWTDLDPFYRGKLQSLSNTTSYEAGPVTLKNIFGYRTVYFHNLSDIDGSEMSMINADNLVDLKQLTDEFQISGTAFNDSLNYIAGVFYSDAKPNGNQRLPIQLFAVSGTPMTSKFPAPFNGAFGAGDYYHDKSKAGFGQVSYKLGSLSHALDGLSVDLGVRYTKDEQTVCDVPNESFADAPVSEGACLSGQALGSSRATADFSKTTYTFGVNYAVTDEVFVYAVTRTGYRAGGLNTPTLGGSLVPFQAYKPETVQDVELGLKTNWSFGSVAGRFNIDVFQSKFKEVQFGVPTSGIADPDGDGNPVDDPAGTTLTTNVGKATVKGVEADLIVAPLRGLELTAGGAYLDKKIDSVSLALPPSLSGISVTKESLGAFAFIGSPDYSYNLGANYTLGLADLGDLRFSAKYFRISDVEYGSVLAPSYDKTDLRVDWLDLLHTGVDVGAFVTNAFDKDGVIAPASSGDAIGVNSAIFNEPRIWGVQVRYTFGKH